MICGYLRLGFPAQVRTGLLRLQPLTTVSQIFCAPLLLAGAEVARRVRSLAGSTVSSPFPTLLEGLGCRGVPPCSSPLLYSSLHGFGQAQRATRDAGGYQTAPECAFVISPRVANCRLWPRSAGARGGVTGEAGAAGAGLALGVDEWCSHNLRRLLRSG